MKYLSSLSVSQIGLAAGSSVKIKEDTIRLRSRLNQEMPLFRERAEPSLPNNYLKGGLIEF
jgi:hypothetical protein